MKVLVLCRYDARGASSRLRILRFLPSLEQKGIAFDVHPFFGPAYLKALYAGDRLNRWDILSSYLRRGGIMGKARPDLIWLEKEFLPWLPHWVERAVLPRGIPYVVDFDDAWSLRYTTHCRAPVRRLLGDKFRGVIQGAAAVVAGNGVLEDWARDLGAARVHRVPTVVDPERYVVTPSPDGPFTIGWIGTPITARYLHTLAPVLRRLTAAGPLRLRVVGAPHFTMEGVTVEALPWSEETEARLIAGMHVGIMPLPDEPWERGKCGYKLIQYMAAGRPVVASPVGANLDIVTPAVGYLVGNEEAWMTALDVLWRDSARRDRMGASARDLVEREYALPAKAEELEAILREASGAMGGLLDV